jgi:hypothetical protein
MMSPVPSLPLQALTNAKAMLGTLAQQHADLEQRRRANLAFSGQTLVGDNLDVLQDAVESIIAAFLLPARVSKLQMVNLCSLARACKMLAASRHFACLSRFLHASHTPSACLPAY